MKAVIERLESDWHRNALANNFASINNRLAKNGFFPESLEGTYGGMFPRTVGALARLWSVTGDWERLASVVKYVFQARKDNAFERIPHVVGEMDESGKIPINCGVDQIDGAASIIFAWTILAEHDLGLAEKAATFAEVTTITDRSTDAPYLSTCTSWRIEPGLVLNTHLEHSREWNYWHAYDFLSQAFVGSALERMIRLASLTRRKEEESRWRERHEFLRTQLKTSMKRALPDGREIYAEMLLPTGREPLVFDGVSWLNLASFASGWTGLEKNVLYQTVEYWRDVAQIQWGGPRLTACEWTPTEGHTNHTYGKMVGWDLLAAIEMGATDIAIGILDFLEKVNTTELYAEIFRYDPQRRCWDLRDAGNGEQAVWLTWALMKTRALLGLDNSNLTMPSQ